MTRKIENVLIDVDCDGKTTMTVLSLESWPDLVIITYLVLIFRFNSTGSLVATWSCPKWGGE